MFYLRKGPYERKISKIKKADGTVIPERTYIERCIALHKDNTLARFYRKPFLGIGENPKGMKLYTCKTQRKILEIRQALFDYCGEWFDVYNENGKVDLNEE